MSEEGYYTYETVKKIVKIEEKNLISEFVNDLYNNDLTIGDMQKKWEDRL